MSLTRRQAVPRAVQALVAVLFAALFFALLEAPAVRAAEPLLVKLVVTTKAGTALSGLDVYAYPVEQHAVAGDGQKAELIGGAYELDLDPEQQYAFYFDSPASSTTSFDQFWGGTTWVEEARYWSIADGRNLRITLATNSVLTGKVTGVSGALLSGVRVVPWRYDGNDWYRLGNAAVSTSSTGVYTMRNLEPGSYRLEFAPSNLTGYLPRYSGGTTVFANAASVNVGLGATVTSNVVLTLGGSIAGAVSFSTTTGEYAGYGVRAWAYPVTVDGTGTPIAIDSARPFTSAVVKSGTWTVKGLPAGRYVVKLYDAIKDIKPDQDAIFVERWAIGHGSTTKALGATSLANAAVYTVATGKTTPSGKTLLKLWTDQSTTSVQINLSHGGTPLPDATTTLYVIPTNPDNDYYLQSVPAEPILSAGKVFLPWVPVGSYQVWVASSAGQPTIFEKSVVDATANVWNLDVADRSAFTYSVGATAPAATQAGAQVIVDRGRTTLDDGAGLERRVDYSYIWLRDGAPIYGAQGAGVDRYTLGGADVGHEVSVLVRADSFGYAPVFSSVELGTVAPGAAPQNLVAPSIAAPGSVVPGSVLTARTGTWNTTGLTFAYQWYASAGGAPTAIAGATQRTFTVRPADAGSSISLQVTASRPGFGSTSVAAGSTVPAGFSAAPVQTKSAVVTKVAIGTDTRFSVTSGTWAPLPDGYGYRWLVDGVEVDDHDRTFDCVAAVPCLPASLVQLVITAHRAGADDGIKTLVIRASTTAPTLAAPGFVWDSTDGGHPSFDAVTDPAVTGHVLRIELPAYDYPTQDGGTLKRTYVWKRNGVAIPKATSATYKPVSADVGKRLTVTVTTTSNLYPKASTTLLAGTGSLRRDLVGSVTPGIVGSTDVGATKIARLNVPWPVSGVTTAYQWFSCEASAGLDCSSTSSANWKAISKATSSKYVPPASMLGDHLLVRVTGSKSGYQSTAPRSAALELTTSAQSVQLLGVPSVSGLVAGSAPNGRTLTGKPATADRTTGVTHAYSWQACDGPAGACTTISGATSTTYAPQPAAFAGLADPYLRFAHTATFGGASDTETTARVEVVDGTQTATVAPKVVTVGSSYVLSGGEWLGATVTRTWYNGASAISSASSIPIPSGTTPVWLEVRAQRAGYADAVVRLVARKGVIATAAIPKSLTGDQYGSPLQFATTPTVPVNPETVTRTYQWYANGVAIKGQTKATFSPSTSYIGKRITVRVTLSSPYYAAASLYSSEIVLQRHAAATGTLTIASTPGTFAPGATLKPALTGLPSSMTYAYTWQRSVGGGTFATVSTKSSYVLTAADANATIRLRVLASKSGWNTATFWSANTAVGYGAALDVTAPVALVGSAKVDTTVSAPTTWNTSGVALTYTWLRNGVAVPGATGSSVTPTASWIGDSLQAVVTATKAGHLPVTVRSDVVRVATGAAPTSAPPTVTQSGSELRTTPGVWNVAGVTITYQWYDAATGAPLAASTASTINWGLHPGVTSFKVVVTASRDGYQDGSIEKVVTRV